MELALDRVATIKEFSLNRKTMFPHFPFRSEFDEIQPFTVGREAYV